MEGGGGKAGNDAGYQSSPPSTGKGAVGDG